MRNVNKTKTKQFFRLHIYFFFYFRKYFFDKISIKNFLCELFEQNFTWDILKIEFPKTPPYFKPLTDIIQWQVLSDIYQTLQPLFAELAISVIFYNSDFIKRSTKITMRRHNWYNSNDINFWLKFRFLAKILICG